MNVSTLNSREDIPFVHTAKAGNWRSGFAEPALEMIENAWAAQKRSV
jgi:hypothetical protein